MDPVTEHYDRADAMRLVTAGLDEIAPDGRRIDLAELAGFDHLHTAGPLSTAMMADLLAPAATDTVLDAGCGLGGPARDLAQRFGCHVIGVDLTPQFVEVGKLLNERTGFDELVDLRVGDICSLELDDASVDHAWTQHVAMNIADRPAMYGEIRRVLRPGGRFAMLDVIDGGGGELHFPVPWASEPEQNHLVSRDALRMLLADAGFRIDIDDDPAGDLVPAMQRMLGDAPPSVLTTAMLIDGVEVKGPNYMRNLAEGRTALALVVCTAVE